MRVSRHRALHASGGSSAARSRPNPSASSTSHRLRSKRNATRRPGAAGRGGAAHGRARAVSASTTRATSLARSRQRALPLAARQFKLHLTACDRYGTRRVRRAVRGGVWLSCWVIACGGGPPPKVRKSCTGCTRARGYGATHGTVARACCGRRAIGATLSRPWSPYSTGKGPLGRPRALGRHDEPEAGAPGARGRAVGIFERGD